MSLWSRFWSLYESGLELKDAFEQAVPFTIENADMAAKLDKLWFERNRNVARIVELMAEIETLKAAAPRWISVKEKMPDVFAWVAQCWVNDKGRVDCGYWDGKHWESMNGNNRTPAPTHWMPLPPPPEEG